MSIPELATQLAVNSLSKTLEDNSRTILLVGSASVGKSTLLNGFLEKNDSPRKTLVLEYSFGRKSNQKQGIEKSICHVWEYGGRLDILQTVLSSIPVNGKYYYCVMIDLSKIKNIWFTMETCVKAMVETYSQANLPELLIICGKYDLFKNYDADLKKFISTSLRCAALLFDAHLFYYSSKEPQLSKRLKELLHGIGFGNGIASKEKNTNLAKPLIIPKGSDSWDSIGVPALTIEQVKARHLARIAPDPAIETSDETEGSLRAFPEPVLDSKVANIYAELRNLETLDISINNYLIGLH